MSITDEIKAFEMMQARLEAEQLGKWAVVHAGELIGVFETFEAAAEDAVVKFGKGPFLIRQIGAPPITLPVSVMYHRVNA